MYPTLFIHQSNIVTIKLQRQAINSAKSSGASQPSCLFYITDASTKRQFLIDTPAEVSVLPPQPNDRANRQGYDLQAGSSSTIATYCTRSLTLNLGLRRFFPWIFSIADVNHAIIGADFLRHCNLLVDLRSHPLIDAVTNLYVNGISSPITAPNLVYAALQSTPFTKLLKEYPDITRPTTKQAAIKTQCRSSHPHARSTMLFHTSSPSTTTQNRQGCTSTYVGHRHCSIF